MFRVIIFLASLVSALAYSGVDVSQSTSSSSFSCLKDNGYHFACVRVYQSNGKCDANGPSTINNAWKGGMKYVDGYIFPCYSCGNPAKQVDDTINCLKSSNVEYAARKEGVEGVFNETLGATYGMLWIDVEGTQVSALSASSSSFLSSFISLPFSL
jgi:hypothetical protein